MRTIIKGSYTVFTDITNDVVKKSLVVATDKIVKEGFVAIKESLSPVSPKLTPSEKAFLQAHYFMMEADPTYPKRYEETLAQIKEQQLVRKVLTPKTTYLAGW